MARKQLSIKGTDSKKHPEVEAAAEKLYELRINCLKLQKDEGLAELAFIASLKKHSLTSYKYQGDESEMEVELVESKEKVKVRKAKDDRDESLDD